MSILSYSDKSLSSAGSSWVSSNTPSDSLKYCSSEEGDFEMDDEQYYSAEEYRDSKQKSGDDYENSLSDDSYDRCQTDDVWEETNQSSRSENPTLTSSTLLDYKLKSDDLSILDTDAEKAFISHFCPPVDPSEFVGKTPLDLASDMVSTFLKGGVAGLSGAYSTSGRILNDLRTEIESGDDDTYALGKFALSVYDAGQRIFDNNVQRLNESDWGAYSGGEEGLMKRIVQNVLKEAGCEEALSVDKLFDQIHKNTDLTTALKMGVQNHGTAVETFFAYTYGLRRA